MVKRGALNKLEKYYIDGNANMPVEDIAIELDRSTKVITNYMTKQNLVENTKVIDKPKPEEEARMFKVMGRHERNGEKVATVMTPAASELADATRSKRIMNKKLQQAIHKPKG